MKYTFYTILTAVLMMFCASCNEGLIPDTTSSEGDCRVTVKVNAPLSTKATGLSDDEDLTVNNLQVFVFMGDNLDVYGSADSTAVEINCTQGQRKIYALINAPSLGSIKTETELLASTSSLSSATVSSLQMMGNTTETITKTTSSVEIDVTRIASRIVVSSIKKNFSSPALQSLTFTVKKIYLVNASGACTYGSPESPTAWYNKLALDSKLSDGVKPLLLDDLNENLATNVAYKTVHTFYCYPNNTKDDTSATGEFTPRYTRLVIEAQLGKDTVYYPISLPEIASNHSYNISEVLITKPGSTSPDEPVSSIACTFTLDIQPWDEVQFTNGTSI